MKSDEEFRSYFKKALKPVLAEFEAKRKSIVSKLSIFGGIIVAIAAVALVFVLRNTSDMVAVFFVLIPAGFLIAGLWWWLTHDFVHEFKLAVIAKIVAFIDPELQYQPTGKISRSDFTASTLFKQRIDRYKGEDLVSGTVGKTAMRFSEVHAEHKTETRDSKGRRKTRWHTIFKGLFFIADFNKEFKGRTVVLPDTAEKLFGRFGKVLQKMNVSRDDLVKLESPEFEKEFAVYGTDQVEARYILSTSLMERILNFKRKTGVQVSVSFVHSNVYVALQTRKDMFEPRIFRTLLSFDLVADYLEDLRLASGIVEDLNLNTRIWTKE
ncbi:MAG: DUF3137 domain-containing protein [Kiritimatiellae bacterium]|nr:DUF3137 domain-containing protein [Kiritimatiellia bacterium]